MSPLFLGLAPWLLGGPDAGAHTLAMHLVEHELQLQVSEARVDLAWQIRIPVHDPSERALLESPAQSIAGLLVEADGRALPLTLVQSQVQDEAKARTTQLAITAALPEGARELRVSTASYPGYPTILTWHGGFARELFVVESSLLPVARDGLVRPAEGKRLVGDGWRVASYTLAHAGPLERAWIALTPEAPSWRPTAEARPQTIRGSALGAGPIGVLMAATLAAGAGAADTRVQSRALGVVFVLWLGIFTLMPEARLGLAAVSVGVALALALRGERLDPLVRAGLGALVAGGLAATAPGAMTAGFVWLAWALGRLAPARPRLALGVAALAAGWLLLRAGIGPG